jgi:hypothetical protein
MCLPVSRLFWVSSLAYPNLLRTKGYVVVVVVDKKVQHHCYLYSRWSTCSTIFLTTEVDAEHMSIFLILG